MEKQIKVLLSSYNGERYIRDQIDSILNQTYQNVELYVRDDGSKDGTLDILKDYWKKGKIHLEQGENIGYIKSFFWLVSNCGEADYYAFSDQDDVWFENKLEMAMEMLKDSDPDVPVLYFSNYDYYDSDLNFLSHHSLKNPNISFVNSLVDCVSLGFNSMFNRKAKDIVSKNIPEKCCGHDWWMYMVCAGMGQVIYDERSTVKYRRHKSNVSDAGDSFLSFQIWRFKKFFLNHHFAKIRDQLDEYASIYFNQLDSDKQKVLKMFVTNRINPLMIIKKSFLNKRYRQGIVDEILLRLVMLLGRL